MYFIRQQLLMEDPLATEPDREVPCLTTAQRRPGVARQMPSGEAQATTQRAGRPTGEPSTMVNGRLPRTLLAR
jgi:hypothetical protein